VTSGEIVKAPAAPVPSGVPAGVPSGDPPPRRRFLIFGVTAIALFMASIDQTIVSTALGTLQHDLHAAINWVSWTITVYALGQIVAMPVAGALSDIYGRKRLFLGAVVLFTVASLCCGLSTNVYELVVLRMLQALGGGAFMPSATGIVSDQFGADRDRAALPLLAGLVSLAAFVRHCVRAEHPFVDIRLFRERSFATMNVINFFNGAAVIGFASLVPFYAEERFGLRALSAGTLLTMRAVGMLAVAALATFALRRTGYRPPMIAGFAVTAIGTALLAFPAGGVSPYAWLAIAAGVTGLGTGVSLPASNNATLQLVPAKAASISGLRGMFRQAGGITGISIASALVARSSHPGLTQAAMFAVLAVIMVLMIPLTFLVPEHRGTW
jgi:MFS family permease